MSDARTNSLLPLLTLLKQRLQIALFPHMITHDFWICQQGSSARAADLLEIYAPLFELLIGKRQVLSAHCVSASGANDVNLFLNGSGRYVVPVTSRVRFLSRDDRATETVTVHLNVADDRELKWAHVYSADARPRRATIIPAREGTDVLLDHHATASVLLLGKGAEPPLADRDAEAIAATRDQLFPQLGRTTAPEAKTTGKETVPLPSNKNGHSPAPPKFARATLQILGIHLGQPGAVRVAINGEAVGVLRCPPGCLLV